MLALMRSRRFARLMLAVPFALVLAAASPALATSEEAGHGEAAHHEPAPINWFELGYKELDIHGDKLAGAGERMAPPLGLALMNFAVFGFILVWKGGPPISKYLRGRHLDIKEALEEGKRLRQEAQHKLEEYTARIKGVEAEVDQLIAEVRASAEGEKQRIIADAERQAELMKKHAEAQIAAEVERARGMLEHEVMEAALAAAETILRERATPMDHQKLVDGFLVDLASAGSATEETSR